MVASSLFVVTLVWTSLVGNIHLLPDSRCAQALNLVTRTQLGAWRFLVNSSCDVCLALPSFDTFYMSEDL